MATSPLAAAIGVRRELIDELQEHIGDESPNTSGEDDLNLAEYLADRLIESGWVRGRPGGEPS